MPDVESVQELGSFKAMQKGFCVKKNGADQNSGVKKLNSKDISVSENLLILKKLNKIKDELKEIKKNL